MPNILIIGHGFVGQAVDYAFSNISRYIVDPKYDTEIPNDTLLHYDIVFVCVPTPMGSDGAIDTSILDSILQRVKDHPLVVVKSTVTPDIIEQYNVVYNPEFLTEKAANEQFVSAKFHILGGNPLDTITVEQFYRHNSLCDEADFYHMTAAEASYVKYTINSFLALKVTFFNQLYDTISATDSNFMTVIKAVAADSRIGSSHTKVPGFDGKQGFGGACFPKDLSAFTKHSNKLTLLEKCIMINNDYRSQYELDNREIEQHVNYGQTKEELQDQINGHPV
jgi:UDPglucose 6-dehydrogenase